MIGGLWPGEFVFSEGHFGMSFGEEEKLILEERMGMKCYQCFLETRELTREVLGICRLCGAGCCQQHLVVITFKRVAGMAGMTQTTRQLRCIQCHEQISAEVGPNKAGPKALPRKSGSWWKWLTRQNAQTSLPSAEEAVDLAESFLKYERKQEELDG